MLFGMFGLSEAFAFALVLQLNDISLVCLSLISKRLSLGTDVQSPLLFSDSSFPCANVSLGREISV